MLELTIITDLVYSNKSDFYCNNFNFIPVSVEDQYEGNNRIELNNLDENVYGLKDSSRNARDSLNEKTSRQVLYLVKAAGSFIQLTRFYHPVTFENTLGMTFEQVVEMTRGLDFTTGCFDHMTLECIVV